MKKAALIINIIFIVLTLVGAVLVICLDLNAGYAVIPAVFALISNLFYRNEDKSHKQ